MKIKEHILMDIPNEGTLLYIKYSENLMLAVPPFLSEAVIEPGNAIYIFMSTENMTFKVFRNVENLLVPLNFWVNGFMTTNLLYSSLSKVAKFSPILKGFVKLMNSHSCSELQQKEISGELPLKTQVKNRVKDIDEVIEEENSDKNVICEKFHTHWFSDNYVVLSTEENPAKLDLNWIEAILLGCDNNSFLVLKMNDTNENVELWAYCDSFNELLFYAKEYSFVRKLVLATNTLFKLETMQELREIEAESSDE